METLTFVPVMGRKADGTAVWYTGRAGEGFISENPKEAFTGYSLDGARVRATNLNKMTALHGVHFIACTGDLALACA